MDATALIIQLVFTFIFAAALVGWFTWPASRANWPVEVVQWAQGHALQLTLRNRAMVVYYVRLSITLRVIGGVGGLVIGALFDDATGLDTSSGAGFWIWIVLGWLVGASWAEYRLTRPPSTGHAASLTPREVLDYLPARLYAAPMVAAGVAVLLAAIGLLAPDPAAPPLHPLPPTAGLVLGAIGAILIAVLIRLAVRAVVARRQPTGPPDIVAADDAIRASAVHNLAGGGTAAILLISSQLAFSVFAPRSGVGGLSFWLAALLALAAFVAWRWSAYHCWRVRRATTAVEVPS